MLELVDLAADARSYVGALARGQKRRLALALALVHDPPIILLDEPLDGIDDVGRGELISVLVELRAMEKTLLIASQSTADVGDVCDVVATFDGGRLEPLARHEPIAFGWIDVVGEVESALRLLREHPGIDDIRHDGGFVTFQGQTSPEERSRLIEWLVGNGVHVAGFGTTMSPAGGARG